MVVRISFHEELDATEGRLLAEGALVKHQLEKVVEAVAERDTELGRAVIEGDDEVDALYLEIVERIHQLMALQAPVARDLRLLSALMHSNLHLERMGDLCVNIAKFVVAQHPYPSGSHVTRLKEMGVRCAEMLDTVLNAFSQRSLEVVETLVAKDEALDRMNRGMLEDLKGFTHGDDESFASAVNLVLVARYLERFGDHCVDIGEQIAFLITGVFREFSDASHPV